MQIFYDKQGKQISEILWEELKWDPLYKILLVNKRGSYKLITCWTGHLGPDKNFESCLYDANDELIQCHYYVSESSATEGHQQLLQTLSID